MTRPNGVSRAANDSRKRIVQPVLPALPLKPKAKKQNAIENKKDTAAANSAENELSTVVQSVEDPHSPAPTFTVAQNAKEESTPGLELNVVDKSDHDVSVPQDSLIDQNISGPLFEDTKSSDTIEAASVHGHDGDLAQTRSENQHVHEESNKQKLDAVSIDEGFAPTTDDPVNAQPDKLDVSDLPSSEQTQDAATEIGNGDMEDDTFLRSETIPDVASHSAESASAGHSARPSLSNSSIQQTPKNGIATPIYPDSNNVASQPTHLNGKHQSLSGDFANGHLSPVPIQGPSSDAIASPAGHQGFPTLLDHIRNLAFSPEWYDSELCIYFQSPKPVIYRNAHSLVLIRSERLRTFIYPQRASSYSYYVINLCPVRPINSNAFDAALRFLYADTILSAERLLPTDAYMDKSGKANGLDYIMSYLVAGLELGIEPVVTRGLDLIGRLLDWDIAELTAKEAALLRSAPAPAMNPHTPPDTQLAAKLIYQHIFNLIVLRLDVQHFKLDSVASPVDMVSRFAQFEVGKPVNPALANMVFGSMPASANLSPTPSHDSSPPAGLAPNSVASVIMLNLEFEELRGLTSSLKRVYEEKGMRVISEVVEERERRRLHIFNNRTASSKQRMANSTAWDVIGWHEYIAEDGLRRERVGFLHPNKRNGNN